MYGDRDIHAVHRVGVCTPYILYIRTYVYCVQYIRTYVHTYILTQYCTYTYPDIHTYRAERGVPSFVGEGPDRKLSDGAKELSVSTVLTVLYVSCQSVPGVIAIWEGAHDAFNEHARYVAHDLAARISVGTVWYATVLYSLFWMCVYYVGMYVCVYSKCCVQYVSSVLYSIY